MEGSAANLHIAQNGTDDTSESFMLRPEVSQTKTGDSVKRGGGGSATRYRGRNRSTALTHFSRRRAQYDSIATQNLPSACLSRRRTDTKSSQKQKKTQEVRDAGRRDSNDWQGTGGNFNFSGLTTAGMRGPSVLRKLPLSLGLRRRHGGLRR